MSCRAIRRAACCRGSARDPPGEYGSGDKRVQAYCFRMCLTERRREPHAVPEARRTTTPKQYELARCASSRPAGARRSDKFDPMPNSKTDTNNHGPFSTDNIGCNYDYPEATYERRREIVARARRLSAGADVFPRQRSARAGGGAGEGARMGTGEGRILDNGNWPHQIYVREARRMVGEYVMTENELLKTRARRRSSVGMGSYTMDSHNVQRYVTPEGHVQNEGDIGVSTDGPYQIAYGSLVPKKRRVREPAGARLPVELAHRLRLDPHGAGVHDPGPIGGDGGGAWRSTMAWRCRMSSMSVWPTDCRNAVKYWR